MGDRDAGEGGHGDRAGDAGDDLHRDARGDARLELLHPAAEDERVTALEPHHPLTGPGVLHEQRVDLLLRHRAAPRQLRRVDDLDVGGQRREQRLGREVVGHDDVGLRDGAPSAHRDQPGVARAATHEDDGAAPAVGGDAGRAVGDAAVGEPGDHRVAHADRALRVTSAVHPHHDVVVPADRRGPDAGRPAVVGPGAEDAGALGLLADRRVHGVVVGRRHGVPGTVEIAGFVPTADPGQRARRDQGLQCRGDRGAHDGDLRPGIEEAGHPAVGDLPAAHDDHAPILQPQADRVDDGAAVGGSRVHQLFSGTPAEGSRSDSAPSAGVIRPRRTNPPTAQAE